MEIRHKVWPIILLIFMGSLNYTWACSCMDYDLDNAYKNSTWVVSGKITTIAIDQKDRDLRIVSLETVEQFKGPNIEHFIIFDPFKDPCAVSLKEGEEVLVYLSKDEHGRAWLSGCQRYFRLNYVASQSIELEILREIKNSKLNYTSSLMLEDSIIEDHEEIDFFYQTFGLKSNPSTPPFGIFEIEYHPLLGKSRVKVIRGFGKNLDSLLVNQMENSGWIFYNPKKVPLRNPEKFFLVLKSDFSPFFDDYVISRYTFK